MRCRQCKERFWVQNRGAYGAAAAMLGGTALFLGLVWLVVTNATRSGDTLIVQPSPPWLPRATMTPGDVDADLRAANAQVPEVQGRTDTTSPEQHAADAAAPQTGFGLKSPDDRIITVQWYRENAKKGDIDAQYKLGLLHLTGRGALQDFAEAAKWLKLAAERGHAQSQYQLGLIYRVGHGVPSDQTQAYKWLNLAAAAGVNEAVLVRNEVMRSLSADQLAQAQQESREWQAGQPKSSQTGQAAAPKSGADEAAAPKPSASKAAALKPSASEAAALKPSAGEAAAANPSPASTPAGQAAHEKSKAALSESGASRPIPGVPSSTDSPN
jgi:hypothetical protein